MEISTDTNSQPEGNRNFFARLLLKSGVATAFVIAAYLGMNLLEDASAIPLAKSEWLKFGRPWMAVKTDNPYFAFNLVLFTLPMILLTWPIFFLHKNPEKDRSPLPAWLKLLGIVVIYMMLLVNIVLLVSSSWETDTWLFVQTIIAALSIGLAEEFFFRGLLFRILRPLSPMYYLFFSSLLFGCLHSEFKLAPFLFATAFGIVAGIARIGGMSLIHLILVHGAVDAVSFLRRPPVTIPELRSIVPYLQNTGVGLALIGLVIAVIYLYRYGRQRRSELSASDAGSAASWKLFYPRSGFKRRFFTSFLLLALFFTVCIFYAEGGPMEYLVGGPLFASVCALVCSVISTRWITISLLGVYYLYLLIGKI